ncbi:hypothetical protein [Lentibacillus sediminis]|uniref:hypothetical protein n=1 Tax=Lentibacillus sediminis TaxID=1940529 RepID=UPI000C1B965F|nr:hypothetical protein [Lentibacillus sediminis]
MRYWKLILIPAMVFVIMGTYYIQSAIAGSGKPEFILQENGGDSELAEDLLLRGHFVAQRNVAHMDNLQITAEGTLYSEELPSYNQRAFYTDPYIANLQNEHRNFMRGKVEDANQYYESSSMLVHATTDNPANFTIGKIELSIEVMQKDSGETSGLTIDIPENYVYMYVEDVRVTNGELKVATQNHIEGPSEYHVYTIDIGQEKLVEDTLIGMETEEQSETENIDSLTMLHGPSDYLVFQQTKRMEVPQENGEIHIEPSGTEFITYNLKTGEQAKLEVPDSLQGNIQDTSVIGSNVYFLAEAESGTELVALEIDTGEIAFQTPVELPVAGEEMRSHMMRVTEDHIYLATPYHNKANQAAILAIDAATGELVYEGTIATEQNQEELPDYTVEFYQMAIQ